MSNIHRKASVGDIVRINAVDWCRHHYQVSQGSIATDVHLKLATVYGVICYADEQRVVISAQTFHGGDERDVLALPNCCILNYEILGEVSAPRFVEQDADARRLMEAEQ